MADFRSSLAHIESCRRNLAMPTGSTRNAAMNEPLLQFRQAEQESVEHLPEISGFAVARMTIADADDWAQYAALPVSNQVVSTITRSAADIVPMIERTLSGDPNAPVLFAVRELATRKLVATVGLHSVSALNRTAEITYTVHPERWGSGTATALCAAAVRWAFDRKRWVRVQATTLEEHQASQQVLLKCGFALEGKVRNYRLFRGEPRDYLLYSIISFRRV